MRKNKSVALGTQFEEFANNLLEQGRYKDINQVISEGLRLLEDEEQKFFKLKNAIKTGIESGIATNFDSKQHQLSLKKTKLKNS